MSYPAFESIAKLLEDFPHQLKEDLPYATFFTLVSRVSSMALGREIHNFFLGNYGFHGALSVI
jgi:hypothetical protein